ncbi:MAG TPA: hypothetical protein VK914_13500 [bacterium]|nr:hypothetical protein [bacterium]
MGTSSYVNADTNEGTENYLSHTRDTRVISSNQWAQTFSFGLTDDLALRLGDTLVLQEDTTTPVNGPSETTYSQGPVDPTVGATWRVVDEDEGYDAQGHFNWDWILSYSPNLFEDQAASPTEDGTNGRGGESASLGTALSWVSPDFTLYWEYLANYLGERDTTNADGTTTDYGSYVQNSFGLNTQTRFTRRFSLNAGVTGYWNGGYTGQNQNTGAGFVVGGGNEIAFNAALNFHFVPRVLVGSLTYANDVYSNRSYAYPANPTNSTTTVNEDVNVFGVRLEYLFL